MKLLLALVLAVPQEMAAPQARAPLFGGVPTGMATAEVLPLSLTDAIERGLAHNLALLLATDSVQAARGARLEALSEVLPHLDGHLSATRQKINLEAFGFTGLPGIPLLVGPFNVVDARIGVSERLFDFEALQKERAESERTDAARYAEKDTRDLVVLACGSLYLRALADSSRIDAARAQLQTAEALEQLASDRKQSGLVPAVDLLRAQVQVKARRQQLIVAENRFAVSKLQLARMIGLPLGQEFRLTDAFGDHPLSVPALEAALAQAYANRADWQAVQAQVRAAEAARRSAWGAALPALDVNADYGAIGASFSDAHATYTLGATLKVPLFEGGKVKSKLLKADADLSMRRAQAEDLRGRIDFDVRTAVLDLTAAIERTEVARSGLELAGEQLHQAQDRFAAGVATNVDVVQAQEAVAAAAESAIASLYDAGLARAETLRALGIAEHAYKELVRGE
jgi:outer membrane protein TolC